MNVTYTARGGLTTHRIRIDFTPQEADALSQLARIFPTALDEEDHLHAALQRVAREFGLDGELPFDTSVPDGACVGPTPNPRNGGSPE